MRGDYELSITFYSVSNPGHRIAERDRCCDLGDPCSDSMCDSYFQLCLRPLGSPVSTEIQTDSCSGRGVVSTSVMDDTDSADFTDTVFGSRNPVILSGSIWVSLQND